MIRAVVFVAASLCALVSGQPAVPAWPNSVFYQDISAAPLDPNSDGVGTPPHAYFGFVCVLLKQKLGLSVSLFLPAIFRCSHRPWFEVLSASTLFCIPCPDYCLNEGFIGRRRWRIKRERTRMHTNTHTHTLKFTHAHAHTARARERHTDTHTQTDTPYTHRAWRGVRPQAIFSGTRVSCPML